MSLTRRFSNLNRSVALASEGPHADEGHARDDYCLFYISIIGKVAGFVLLCENPHVFEPHEGAVAQVNFTALK